MTDYGLELRNNANIVLIDSTYKNHSYLQSGTTFVDRYLTHVSVNPVSTSPLFFINAPVMLAYNYGIQKNGSDYDEIVIAADSTGYVSWILYQEGHTQPLPDFGMIVYNLSSEVIFQSAESGYVNVSNERSYGSSGNVSVQDAVNNYFVITGGENRYTYSYSGGYRTETRFMSGFKYVDPTTVNINDFAYFSKTIFTGESGAGSGASGSASSPQQLIELSPPLGF